MVIRVEVLEDCKIEIMRPGAEIPFTKVNDLDEAMQIIRFMLKNDLRQAKEERYITETEKESIQIFKEYKEKANAQK